MAGYTNEFSSFPTSLLTRHNYKDVDDSVADDVNKIKTYIAAGNYSAALQYIEEDPTLKQYIFGADAINAIEEETRNVEIYAKNVQQQIYYEGNESDILSTCSQGDIWIS